MKIELSPRRELDFASLGTPLGSLWSAFWTSTRPPWVLKGASWLLPEAHVWPLALPKYHQERPSAPKEAAGGPLVGPRGLLAPLFKVLGVPGKPF